MRSPMCEVTRQVTSCNGGGDGIIKDKNITQFLTAKMQICAFYMLIEQYFMRTITPLNGNACTS